MEVKKRSRSRSQAKTARQGKTPRTDDDVEEAEREDLEHQELDDEDEDDYYDSEDGDSSMEELLDSDKKHNAK